MTLVAIGAIPVNFRDPQIRKTARQGTGGVQAVQITGLMQLSSLKMLLEMTSDPSYQTTKGQFTGVLEWLEFTGIIVGEMTGWHIIENAEEGVNHRFSLGGSEGLTPFVLSTAFFGGMIE